VTGDPWTDAGLQDLHEALATLELLEDWLQRRPLPAMSPAEGERVSFAVQLARRSLRRGCGLAIAYDRGPIRGETPPEEGDLRRAARALGVIQSNNEWEELLAQVLGEERQATADPLTEAELERVRTDVIRRAGRRPAS
jgi:hypothetical protein